MTYHRWTKSKDQHDVWWYSGEVRPPCIRLSRIIDRSGVCWRAEYVSRLQGSIKTPRCDSASEALQMLKSELNVAGYVGKAGLAEFDEETP